jgi:hypothetical protein
MASAGQAYILLHHVRDTFCSAGPFRGALLHLRSAYAPEGEDIVVRQLLKGVGGHAGNLATHGYHFGPSEYEPLFALLTLCFAFSWDVLVVLAEFEMAVDGDNDNFVGVTLRNPNDATAQFLAEMGFKKVEASGG